MNPAPAPEKVNNGFQVEDQLMMEYLTIMKRFKTGQSPAPDPNKDNKLRDIYAIRKSGRLLDVGCSVGDFLHKAKYFYEVEGVEINPVLAEIAERYSKVHKCFLNEMPLGTKYDVVTLHQLLYGIPDPVGMLKEIANLLEDDGILYINSPNADSYANEQFRGKSNHFYGYGNLNVFNRRSLEVLAAQACFDVLAFRTEWLDIYLTDLTEFYEHPGQFIHKRNCHLPRYEKKIQMEESFHQTLQLDLKDRGHYFVAVLGKRGKITVPPPIPA